MGRPDVGTTRLPAEARVLVVDDDRAGSAIVTQTLEIEGYEVRVVGSAAAARATIVTWPPDLIILELLLPDEDGLVLCAALTARPRRSPILVCTATRRVRDEVLSLKLGADDFIAKPVDPYQLTARVQALLRRAPPAATRPARVPSSTEILQVGDLVIDQGSQQATVAEAALHLTPVELRLLIALTQHFGEVLPREMLARLVWGARASVRSRTLDVHAGRLRGKLVSASKKSLTVTAVRGFGYKLHRPDEP